LLVVIRSILQSRKAGEVSCPDAAISDSVGR
jgi:hypothetical protein